MALSPAVDYLISFVITLLGVFLGAWLAWSNTLRQMGLEQRKRDTERKERLELYLSLAQTDLERARVAMRQFLDVASEYGMSNNSWSYYLPLAASIERGSYETLKREGLLSLLSPSLNRKLEEAFGLLTYFRAQMPVCRARQEFEWGVGIKQVGSDWLELKRIAQDSLTVLPKASQAIAEALSEA